MTLRISIFAAIGSLLLLAVIFELITQSAASKNATRSCGY